MFLPLKFVIVLASIVSTVLSSDPGVHTCTRKNPYKVIDYSRTYQYAIYGGQIQVKTADINFKTDFERGVIYGIVPFTTMHFSSHANRTRVTDPINDGESRNWAFLWKHQGQAVVTTRIVETESNEDKIVGGKECQVITFTMDEQWVFENATQSRMVLDVPSEWYHVYKEITTVIRKLSLACLKEHICAAVDNFLEESDSDSSEESPPIRMRANVNNAVDKSLIRIRHYIQKRNETIEIPDIRRNFTSDAIEFNATGGTFTNLSTIVRTGDAVVKIQLHEYSITSTYTLRKAHIDYDHYNIKYESAQDEGKIFVSIQNLKIQGRRTLNATDCHVLSQHINVTSFGILKYMLGKFPFLKGEEPNSKERVLRNVKELIESPLVKALENAFDYEDTIFGPCMTNAPKEHIIYRNDLPS